MHYARNTQRIYRKVIRRFIDFLEDKSAATVTHTDVRLFLARISEDGASLGTVYRQIGVLRLFYDFLNLGGVVSYVAPRLVKLRRPWWNSLPALTEAQVQNLIEATLTLRDRALVEFFYATGCRLNEVIHLKVENVDLEGRTAVIRGKLGKVRTVLLTKNAAAALRAYVGNRRSGFVFQQERPIVKGCLTTANGKWLSLWPDYSGPERVRRRKYHGGINDLTYEEARKKHEELMAGYNLVRPAKTCSLSKMAVQKAIQNIAKRAGLKRVSPHTLRRTFATHLYDHGAGVEVIKALMGHVWIHTTLKYARISTDRLAKTFDQCHPRGQLNDQVSS